MPARDEDESLLEAAKQQQTDPAAQLVRARLKQRLLGKSSAPPKLGRFVVLELVGSGAMGMVYAAYDPVLDRRVALKVLKSGLREARSLAKLTHPNVVAVYDAGEADGRAYIAMEFVQGDTLRAWLNAAPRSQSEVLETFSAAATGLAAAHQAGIVHSDFKPENVLVGEDRVRVADFGVAYIQESTPDQLRGGTPAYMAPEQKRGERPTPASDQFAFCVALFEALAGHRPFDSEGERKLPQKAIPTRVLRVLERGLLTDPLARHPSMEALRSALRPDMATRKRRHGAALLAVVVALIAIAYVSREDPCQGGTAIVGKIVYPERKDELSARLIRNNPGYGPAASLRITSALDRFAEAWQVEHRTVCEATRVHSLQSDSSYDAKMGCLKRQLRATDSLIDALLELRSTPALAKGVAASAGLVAQLNSCADAWPQKLLGDEGKKAQRLSDESWMRYRLGQYSKARELAAAAVVEAKHSSNELLVGEALFARAAAEGRTRSASVAEVSLERALHFASRAQHDPLIAQIWIWLLRSKLFSGRYQEVIGWAPFVRSVAVRGRARGAAIDGIIGEAQLQSGAPLKAVETLKDAIEVERAEGPSDRLAVMYTNLGTAMLSTGAYRAADAHFQTALGMMKAHVGDLHPGLGFYFEKLGRSRLALGEYEEARAFCERALKIRKSAFGPEDRAVATSALCLADVLLALGDVEPARAHLSAALAIRTSVYGQSHPSLARVYRGFAALNVLEHNWAEAEAALKKAIALRRVVSASHPSLAIDYARLADVYSRKGQSQDVADALQSAKRIVDALGYIGPAWLEVLLVEARLASGKARAELLARARRDIQRLALPSAGSLARAFSQLERSP